MFDLEKFKTGNFYVHIPTQELYDEVMEFLDNNGFKWLSGNKMNYENFWSREKENTTIGYDDVDHGVSRSDLLFQNQLKVREELELNNVKKALKVGDKVRVNVNKINVGFFKKGDIGYVASVETDYLTLYYVVKDKELVGKDVFDIPYHVYGVYSNAELEKLHSHAEVNAQLGLVRTLSMGKRSNEERYTELMLENKEIYLDKNKKYGDAFAETIQKYGYISAITRMNDKFNRIEQFTIEGFEDEEESLRDSLMDLANYCYMYVMELDNE